MTFEDLRRDMAITARKLGHWPVRWFLVESDFCELWVQAYSRKPNLQEAPHYMLLAGCKIIPVPEVYIDLPLRP